MRSNSPRIEPRPVTGWTLWQPVFLWGAVGTAAAFALQFGTPKTGFLDMRSVVAGGLSMIVVGALCLWRWITVLNDERFAHLWRGHAWLLALGTLVAMPPLFVLIGFSMR